jgi:hypothetical protein
MSGENQLLTAFIETRDHVADIRSRFGSMETSISSLTEDIAELKSKMVTRKEFEPVRLIAYGAVALLASATLALVLSVN